MNNLKIIKQIKLIRNLSDDSFNDFKLMRNLTMKTIQKDCMKLVCQD